MIFILYIYDIIYISHETHTTHTKLTLSHTYQQIKQSSLTVTVEQDHDIIYDIIYINHFIDIIYDITVFLYDIIYHI